MYSVFIDGIDGSGKSSAARRLFDLLEDTEDDVSFFKFPTKPPETGYGKRNGHNFYLQDFFETMSEHRGIEDVRIFDRSFVTTMAYQGFTGKLTWNDRIMNQILYSGADSLFTSGHVDDRNPRTMFFFSFTCAVEESVRRILNRSNVAWSDEVDLNPDPKYLDTLQQRYHRCYGYVMAKLPQMYPDHQHHFFLVDTTHLNENEVLEKMVSDIRSVLDPDQRSLCV